MKAKGKKAAPKKAPVSKASSAQAVALDLRIEPQTKPKLAAVPPLPPSAEPLLEPLPLQESYAAEEIAPSVTSERRPISADERRDLIAIAAYQRAERIGLGSTDPVEDWLCAEREIDALLAQGER